MAIFIGTKNDSGQVSVCGDAYRGGHSTPQATLGPFVFLR